MPDDKERLRRQIEDASTLTGLPLSVIEKDFYVTRLIHILSNLDNKNYRLVFQGGTCLAKAYKLIPRMSEDCDFRIEALGEVKNYGRDKRRRTLKKFRQEVVELLGKNGFETTKENIKTRDEGTFMSMELPYPSLYKQAHSLKQHIAVDFFLTDVKTPTKNLPVTSIIKEALGDKTNHLEKNIECVSITETAVEKWIGLTRRIATIKHREYYNDPSLVRHIYDLYKIKESEHLNDEFPKLAMRLINAEKQKYKSHNADYFEDPLGEIKKALLTLKTDQKWQNNWNQFINDLVFEKTPPTYEAAWENLNSLSKQCIKERNRHNEKLIGGALSELQHNQHIESIKGISKPPKEMKIDWLSDDYKKEWEGLREIDNENIKLFVDLHDISLNKNKSIENPVVFKQMEHLVVKIFGDELGKAEIERIAPKLSSQIKIFAKHREYAKNHEIAYTTDHSF